MLYAAPTGTELRNVYQANIWPGQYYNQVAQLMTRSPSILTNVDATGRVGNVSFYVSGNYTDEAGALSVLNGVQNKRARVNLDYDARSDLKISVSTFADKLNDDNDGFNFGGLLRGMLPGVDQLMRDSLGRAPLVTGGSGYRPTGNGGGNLVYGPENNDAYRVSTRFLGSITARYFPTDWATFEATAGYDTRARQDVNITPSGSRSTSISAATNKGNMSISSDNSESVNAALSATFRSQLGEELSGKLSFRGLYDESNDNSFSTAGQVFTVKDIHTLGNTTTNKSNGSGISTVKNVGLFAGARWTTRIATSSKARSGTTAPRSSAPATGGRRSAACLRSGTWPASRSGMSGSWMSSGSAPLAAPPAPRRRSRPSTRPTRSAAPR